VIQPDQPLTMRIIGNITAYYRELIDSMPYVSLPSPKSRLNSIAISDRNGQFPIKTVHFRLKSWISDQNISFEQNFNRICDRNKIFGNLFPLKRAFCLDLLSTRLTSLMPLTSRQQLSLLPPGYVSAIWLVSGRYIILVKLPKKLFFFEAHSWVLEPINENWGNHTHTKKG